jgi:hypothetical protein
MAGLVPAIHELSCGTKNVDARDKPGHDEFVERANSLSTTNKEGQPAWDKTSN